MHEQFNVTACIKLVPTDEKSLSIDDVSAIVDNSFAKHLSDLYESILEFCEKELGTADFSVINTRITPVSDGMEITVNVLLAKAQIFEGKDESSKNGKVKFKKDLGTFKKLGIHRLIKYMELKARQKFEGEFDSLVHLRVIPVDNDDFGPDRF